MIRRCWLCEYDLPDGAPAGGLCPDCIEADLFVIDAPPDAPMRTLRPLAPQGTEMSESENETESVDPADDVTIPGSMFRDMHDAYVRGQEVEHEWKYRAQAAEAQVEALRKALEPLLREVGNYIGEVADLPASRDNLRPQAVEMFRQRFVKHLQPVFSALSAPAEARSEQPNWRCRKCGADFVSRDGKIVGGQCPTNTPTCPLEPI